MTTRTRQIIRIGRPAADRRRGFALLPNAIAPAAAQPDRGSASGSGADGLVWDDVPDDLQAAFVDRRLTLAAIVAARAAGDLGALRPAAEVAPGPDWDRVPDALQVAFLERRATLAQVEQYLRGEG